MTGSATSRPAPAFPARQGPPERTAQQPLLGDGDGGHHPRPDRQRAGGPERAARRAQVNQSGTAHSVSAPATRAASCTGDCPGPRPRRRAGTPPAPRPPGAARRAARPRAADAVRSAGDPDRTRPRTGPAEPEHPRCGRARAGPARARPDPPAACPSTRVGACSRAAGPATTGSAWCTRPSRRARATPTGAPRGVRRRAGQVAVGEHDRATCANTMHDDLHVPDDRRGHHAGGDLVVVVERVRQVQRPALRAHGVPDQRQQQLAVDRTYCR